VRKDDGSLRLCIDYRGLNEVTRKDAYPLPRVDDTLDELKDAKFYTHLDLASGFWQVRVRDQDILKTAFQTHDGLMEWVAMPFGQCNAPAAFQRMMNDILRDFLHKFVTVYLDDVFLCSRTLEDNMEHLRIVLHRFKEEGLKLRLKKCFFGLQEMEYLGYTVSACKISVSTKESRGRCRPASAQDGEGRSQFRTVLQLICQIYSSFQRPYGSIDGLAAKVPAT
jgi:hypothetical protein